MKSGALTAPARHSVACRRGHGAVACQPTAATRLHRHRPPLDRGPAAARVAHRTAVCGACQQSPARWRQAGRAAPSRRARRRPGRRWPRRVHRGAAGIPAPRAAGRRSGFVRQRWHAPAVASIRCSGQPPRAGGAQSTDARRRGRGPARPAAGRRRRGSPAIRRRPAGSLPRSACSAKRPSGRRAARRAPGRAAFRHAARRLVPAGSRRAAAPAEGGCRAA